jgi:LuxR family maltose regulon positive regulatory protein
VERLDGARDARLVLVDAPPGWGKTTALSDWVSERPHRVAWVSLDPNDNDPVRFWTYVLAALQGIDADLGRAARARLGVHGIDLSGEIVPALVNDLATFTDDVYLVLDDYHVVTHPDISASVSALIAALPPQAHVVLATRADPPFPLPQLRARGELLEVRAEHLRFTEAETATLLNSVLSLSLADGDVELLQERTEGWAAGLQLAGMTLRDRTDASAFIGAFAGDNRHVVDYLVTEVLDALPHELRQFLLQTSVLDRLCGPLCDTITGGTDSAALLVEIERNNLFLVPLDPRRQWYRFHHLFAELLRHELAVTQPATVPVLHQRAAMWLEESDDIPAAVHHAAASDDDDLVVRLIGTYWRRYFNSGQLATVERWLALVPPTTVVELPELSIAAVWVALDQGRLAEADRWLTLIEARRAADPDAAVLRSVWAFKSGDVSRARQLVMTAEAGADDFTNAVREIMVGVTDYWAGRGADALHALVNVTNRTRADNPLGTLYSLGYLALTRLRMRDLEGCRAALAETVDLCREPLVGGHFVAMTAQLATSQVAELDDDLPAAVHAASSTVELARRGAGRVELAAALAMLSHVLRRAGRAEEARAALAESRALAAACADPGPVLSEALALGSTTSAVPTQTTPEALTDRELTVLRMLPGDATTRELAAAIFVSPNTVKTHLKAIYRKIGATNREDAVRRARDLGLIGRGQAR